jgi:hypothetical protein
VNNVALPGRVLGLQLEGCPSHEAYGRVLAAVDAGRLTMSEAKTLTEILFKGLTLHDAKVMGDKIALVEQKALEAARIAGRALAAPGQRVIEAQAAAGDRGPEGVARGG